MKTTGKLKKWVLLADDDRDLVELYESFLEMEFGETVKIVTAEDGVVATSKLPFQAFDLIITDLKMPRKSGQAFMKAVKESQLNEHTPLVVITGDDTAEEIDREKVSVLLKPIDQSKFIEIVAAQLKLGKTDQRIAADLLNTFIDSGVYLLEKIGQLSATQLPPSIKKDGEDIDGSFMELISIRVGKVTNNFIFSFDEGLVSMLGEKVNKTDPEEILKVVETAGDTIVRYSVRRFSGQNISILQENRLAKGEDGYKSVLRSKGLKIPIETPRGYMYIYGLLKTP